MPPRRTKDQRKLRRKSSPNATLEGERRVKSRRAHNREFNYVLGIRDEDLQIIREYQATLSQGVASFADVYYNYLFDNPSTADVLYNCERQGGNISDYVRAQLRQLAKIPTGLVDDENAEELLAIGRLNHAWKVGPIWVTGALRLYLEHLRHIIETSDEISPDHRPKLETVLFKLMNRALGIMMQGYWEVTLEAIEAERVNSSPDYLQLVEILRNIPLVVWSVEVPSLRVAFASPATRSICQEELTKPIPCLGQVHADDKEHVMIAWEQALNGLSAQVDCRADLGVGGERNVRFLFSPFRTGRGEVIRVDCLLEDRTEDRESAARLEELATTDGLTGLANRVLWQDRLDRALSAIRRNGGQQAVVMMLDLNQFKEVNDNLGHAAGDEVLRKISERLRSTLRDSDTVARLGGDEFAILLPSVEDAKQAGAQVANKLQGCFAAPVHYNGEDLYVSGAIGIAIAPEHGEDADTLVQRADTAMYRAKQAELPQLFFNPKNGAPVGSGVQFTRQLQSALSDKQFELYYQPKIDVKTSELCGAEALIRWQHPEEGLVMPDRFISLAERIGLMAPITEWVLSTALMCCKQWSEHGVGVPVAVNVSTRSFLDPLLLDKIKNALHQSGANGEMLEIEVNENTLMSDVSQGSKIIGQLAELGVSVSLDDFGTGYCSLSFLQRLPVRTLKIDKSFLANLAGANNSVAMVRSIIELGHNLDCKVVAEGVETSQAWKLLTEMGCDQVQGFHVSHPLSEGGFEHWLADSSNAGAELAPRLNA